MAGPTHRRHTLGRKATPDSKSISALIVILHDERGLSFDQISARLHMDHRLDISRAAVWQRYQREKRNHA